MLNISPEHPLPRRVNPRKFAQQGIHLRGQLPVNELQRLCSLLANGDGEVTANLDFSVDEQGFRCLTGHAEVELNMICQRCLDVSLQLVRADFNLAMVYSDEQSRHLPKALDPWTLEEGQTDLYQIIEDELILSLPMVAYHQHECVAKALFSAGDNREVAEDTSNSDAAGLTESSYSRESNPFQVLKTLKGSLEATPTIHETPESSKSDK